MTELSYAKAPLEIPAGYEAEHRRVWLELAQPGTWWTGAERVDIAREVRVARECALCTARKTALSPSSVQGDHDSDSDLPPYAVDAVHRIVTDPTRLTKTWLEGLRGAGLEDGHYAELLGVVGSTITIDAFCRAVGVSLHELPSPTPGEASRYRPSTAAKEEGWLPMIPVDRATGQEADLYPNRRVPNLFRALSLVPDAVRTLKRVCAVHYLPLETIPDLSAEMPGLNRAQMELVAARVSALRECFY